MRSIFQKKMTFYICMIKKELVGGFYEYCIKEIGYAR